MAISQSNCDMAENKQELRNLRTILNHLTKVLICNILELYIFFTFTFGTLFAFYYQAMTGEKDRESKKPHVILE
jgi:hypothetical protein